MIQNLSAQESKDFSEIIRMIKSDHEDDEIEVNKTFISGALDRYPRQLDEEESLKLLSNKYLDNKDRPKYVGFFNEVINSNKVVFVNCTNLVREDRILKNYKERLTKTEFKHLLLLKSKSLIKSKFIKTDNLQVLNFMCNLSLKEIIFFDFFIPERNTIIIGNFDLSLPVYAREAEDIKHLAMIAEKYELYIRDIE